MTDLMNPDGGKINYIDKVDHILFNFYRSCAKSWQDKSNRQKKHLERIFNATSALSLGFSGYQLGGYLFSSIGLLPGYRTIKPRDTFEHQNAETEVSLDVKKRYNRPSTKYVNFGTTFVGSVTFLGGLYLIGNGFYNKDQLEISNGVNMITFGMGLLSGSAADYMSRTNVGPVNNTE